MVEALEELARIHKTRSHAERLRLLKEAYGHNKVFDCLIHLSSQNLFDSFPPKLNMLPLGEYTLQQYLKAWALSEQTAVQFYTLPFQVQLAVFYASTSENIKLSNRSYVENLPPFPDMVPYLATGDPVNILPSYTKSREGMCAICYETAGPSGVCEACLHELVEVIQYRTEDYTTQLLSGGFSRKTEIRPDGEMFHIHVGPWYIERFDQDKVVYTYQTGSNTYWQGKLPFIEYQRA